MKRFNETYRNRQFVSRNQWADTYKAIHATTEEEVVLKVLVNQSNDEEYINNLLEEVEKIKSIRNDNLININDIFKYSAFGKTYPYIEGEYFKGISLREKISTTKYSNEEAVKIALNLGKIIREFHSKNTLFNNLTLDNIYINSKNIIKLDIFTYLENKEFNNTEDENIHKDIYDLGVILYSLLSRELTFEKDKLKRYINDKNLLCIIEKATNENLENKYLTINRFIADLKSYLSCGVLISDDMYKEEEIVVESDRKKGNIGKKLGICATIALAIGGSVYGYDLLQKNSNINDNKTEVLNEKVDKEDKEANKEKNEEKTEVKKGTKENQSDISNNMSNNKPVESNNSKNNTINNINTGSNITSNNESSSTIDTTQNDNSNSGSSDESTDQGTESIPSTTPDNSGSNNEQGENITTEIPVEQGEGE